MAFISDDSMGTRTKMDWADANTYVDPNDKGNVANRQDGGWYFNKDSGYVEMWKADGGGGGSGSGNSGSSNSMSSNGGLSSSGGNTSVDLQTRPKIDLQAEYNGLYDSLGISGMKDAVKTAQQAILAARAEADQAASLVNENPFYSEGNRTGRIAKIEEAYALKEGNLAAQVALKQQALNDTQAELSTQMGLKTQQYGYDVAAYEDSISQMNMLLQQGALNDADEASLERIASTTGISISMIRSMINAQKQQNYKPALIQNVDDNGNVTVSLVDSTTGKIINQQSLGQVEASNAAKWASSGSSTSSTADAKQTAENVRLDTNEALKRMAKQNVKWGKIYGTTNNVGTEYVQVDQWRDIFYDWQRETGGSYSQFRSAFSSYLDPKFISDYDEAIEGVKL
jgi:hypothetical protein